MANAANQSRCSTEYLCTVQKCGRCQLKLRIMLSLDCHKPHGTFLHWIRALSLCIEGSLHRNLVKSLGAFLSDRLQSKCGSLKTPVQDVWFLSLIHLKRPVLPLIALIRLFVFPWIHFHKVVWMCLSSSGAASLSLSSLDTIPLIAHKLAAMKIFSLRSSYFHTFYLSIWWKNIHLLSSDDISNTKIWRLFRSDSFGGKTSNLKDMPKMAQEFCFVF